MRTLISALSMTAMLAASPAFADAAVSVQPLPAPGEQTASAGEANSSGAAMSDANPSGDGSGGASGGATSGGASGGAASGGAASG
ncbi:MAG TPA: hypothetical protein VIM02_02575, partial [Rhizomicrobium sp.]